MNMERALRLPVVAAGAEYLVMGHLMRRNILTYKAPSGNGGYDLICIHPDPRHPRKRNEMAQVRVQVKSRYATDCDRGFPLKEGSIGAFDFLVAAFLNIGRFLHGRDGGGGARNPEFYTLPATVIRSLHQPSGSWQKVRLRRLGQELEQYRDEAGFEQIAQALGIVPPRKVQSRAPSPATARRGRRHRRR